MRLICFALMNRCKSTITSPFELLKRPDDVHCVSADLTQNFYSTVRVILPPFTCPNSIFSIIVLCPLFVNQCRGVHFSALVLAHRSDLPLSCVCCMQGSAQGALTSAQSSGSLLGASTGKLPSLTLIVQMLVTYYNVIIMSLHMVQKMPEKKVGQAEAC